ncbi:MAG: tRNA (adenosine(37)-N6)-threonylcarbamoyltransferase complex ATPase subunit type 1 TsaE [Planctomycetes bacterium]|nr:tRNA (adenosine(37)-N6)-threonylcarbamoyltransferase complex ATPase subunit type 1 TsaE [Planctomycetota bacterium]
MQHWTFTAPDEQATVRLASALAAALPRRAMLALDGPLGAGKTRLVRALAAAAGADERAVSSPTFVLVHEYPGPQPMFHFDAYRLKRPEDLLDLTVDEYLASDGWTVIEWAERVADYLPSERLAVRIASLDATTRQFDFTARGSEYEATLDKLASELRAH